MKPLRMAVIGAGLIGRRHIQTIRSMPEVAELLAVADPQLDGSGFDLGAAGWFGDPHEMLDQVKPEAVVIATPNALHRQHGQWCCERGIHFLMEKPVTPTLDEASSLIQAVQLSGVKTLVGHHRRYLGTVQQARQWVVDGRMGRLVVASVLWATRKPQEYFQTDWRTQPGGGPLLINAIHEIDMLRYLCGEIRAVSGIKSHANRGLAVEDTAAAVFEFENGCLGTLACTDAGLSPWTIEQGSGENPSFGYTGQSAYRIVGTTGSLELPVLRAWSARLPGEAAWDKPIVGDYLLPQLGDPYQEQLRHFQRLVRLDEQAVVSVLDGARTLAATLAVAQSSETHSRCFPRRF